jgi:hypothetical protein
MVAVTKNRGECNLPRDFPFSFGAGAEPGGGTGAAGVTGGADTRAAAGGFRLADGFSLIIIPAIENSLGFAVAQKDPPVRETGDRISELLTAVKQLFKFLV